MANCNVGASLSSLSLLFPISLLFHNHSRHLFETATREFNSCESNIVSFCMIDSSVVEKTNAAERGAGRRTETEFEQAEPVGARIGQRQTKRRKEGGADEQTETQHARRRQVGP